MINNNIVTMLNEMEKQENITILFACESGSRAWDMHTLTSDYDVRFIYKHDLKWYLQLYEERNVLEWEDNQIEYVGWDIKKVLQLLQKSNPTLLEWLYSPYIYKSQNPFTKEVKHLAKQFFSPISVLHHYVSMAKKNYHALQKTENPRTKAYLNCIKPIVCSLWIVDNQEFPHIGEKVLFEKCSEDRLVLEEVERLIYHKKSGRIYYISQILNDYIKTSIKELEKHIRQYSKTERPSMDSLNTFLFDIIMS